MREGGVSNWRDWSVERSKRAESRKIKESRELSKRRDWREGAGRE